MTKDAMHVATDSVTAVSTIVFEFFRAVVYERLIRTISALAAWLHASGALEWLTLLLPALIFMAMLAATHWKFPRRWMDRAATFAGRPTAAPQDVELERGVLEQHDRELQQDTLNRLRDRLDKDSDGILLDNDRLSLNWRPVIIRKGPVRFCASLAKSKKTIRTLDRQIQMTIRRCKSHNKRILLPLSDGQLFRQMSNAIDEFAEAARKLPDKIEPRTLDLLTRDADAFAAEVALFKQRLRTLQRDVLAASRALDAMHP